MARDTYRQTETQVDKFEGMVKSTDRQKQVYIFGVVVQIRRQSDRRH